MQQLTLAKFLKYLQLLPHGSSIQFEHASPEIGNEYHQEMIKLGNLALSGGNTNVREIFKPSERLYFHEESVGRVLRKELPNINLHPPFISYESIKSLQLCSG